MNSRLRTGRGIYLITPDQPDTDLLCAQLTQLLKQPIALLQYRNKLATKAVQRRQAEHVRALSARAGVPLIINDDWRLALDIGADGVHLGENDPDPVHVRDQAGAEMIIGVSCYNSYERAQTLAKNDVDYLAFGAMFTSSTKPEARHAELSLLSRAKSLNKPIVAIGGITPDNSETVINAGADYIAVISGVFSSDNPEQTLQLYINSFTKARP